jgi:uncharacterized protein YjbJ (UPF0337 family)
MPLLRLSEDHGQRCSPFSLGVPVPSRSPEHPNRSQHTTGTVSIGVSSDDSEASGARVRATSTTRKEAVVSFADKFRNKAQELRGRIKRNTGEVTGDRRLQSEGRADEVKSNLKQAGEKVKDAFRGRGTRRRRRQY